MCPTGKLLPFLVLVLEKMLTSYDDDVSPIQSTEIQTDAVTHTHTHTHTEDANDETTGGCDDADVDSPTTIGRR
jgi:hypothetical protein